MKILIADDNAVVRKGVRNILLRPGNWEVCGEAASGLEALERARELKPDVALLDIRMPGTNGLETARRLRRELPQIKILIMSQFDPEYLLPRALQAGANACIDKTRLGTDLLNAVKSLEDASPEAVS
ncbi:MAG TPA: response regulator transcription factor [Terriglobales bacterium]|nr:response regulator transcription factor [Terriglobales bacterium]